MTMSRHVARAFHAKIFTHDDIRDIAKNMNGPLADFLYAIIKEPGEVQELRKELQRHLVIKKRTKLRQRFIKPSVYLHQKTQFLAHNQQDIPLYRFCLTRVVATKSEMLQQRDRVLYRPQGTSYATADLASYSLHLRSEDELAEFECSQQQ